MIIHSIVPIEFIFSGSYESTQKSMSITYQGEPVEVVPSLTGGFIISRVLSTSLDAYLNPNLQPGMEIKL